MAEWQNRQNVSLLDIEIQENELRVEEQDKTIESIRHKIVVLSGKGGVGKSTIAVNLAVSLVISGKRVGLLDVDIHGPSVPKMLCLEGSIQEVSEHGRLVPVDYKGLKVMSIGFLLPGEEESVIWRAPAKEAAIRQFIAGVEWGDLDYLVIDCPPGTGDEPLTVVQALDRVDSTLIVTTPQDLAITDVRKAMTFCNQLNMPVMGIIENMSGFICPHCGETVDIFKSGGGEELAREMCVPFLGRIPVEMTVMTAADDGTPHAYLHGGSEAARAFSNIARLINDRSCR